MSVVEQLKAARALIESEDAWTKGANACDAYEGAVRSADPRAVAWCAAGALERVGASDAAFSALEDEGGGSITAFNDNPYTAHGQVLEAFDRAIANAKQ